MFPRLMTSCVGPTKSTWTIHSVRRVFIMYNILKSVLLGY